MAKISIIMPIYNGGQWLSESINSVLNQTFRDFELICINDSSTDNSEDILKEFLYKDDRIKYYTKENEGPGMALNYGIEKAKGEYLCFIDQDDKYTPNYLEKMYNLVLSTACDVAICNGYFWEDTKIEKIPYPQIKSENNIVDIKELKNKKKFYNHFFPQWTKIIKKDFWVKNHISFPDRNNKAHDVPPHYEIIILCDKIGYTEDCLYYHRHYPEQISYDFDVPLWHYHSIRNVFDWAKKFRNKTEKKYVKKYMEYVIKLCSKVTHSMKLQDKLLDLFKEEYSFILDFSLFLILNKNKKKLEKNIRMGRIPIKDLDELQLKEINIPYVGRNSYCATHPIIVNSKTKIGSFVSIGENVRIGQGKHPLNFLSTSPYFYFDNLQWKSSDTESHNEFWDYEPVTIGNDVWIGDNVLIKNGVKISDGAVIAMGAVVTKDVPPYSIVGGVPAKVIRYRFDKEIINKLIELEWWNLDDMTIKKIPYDDVNQAIDFIEKEKRKYD